MLIFTLGYDTCWQSGLLTRVIMSKNQHIYLDHNATAPLHPQLFGFIEALVGEWGNPSSVHMTGRGPKQMIRKARTQVANHLNIHPLEVIFTSGGSEANNSAIFSVFNTEWLVKGNKSAEFITSNVEHPSVSKVFDLIESYGAKVHRVPLTFEGEFDLDFYKSVLNENTKLVSIMYANNETGALLPIIEITKLAKKFDALVHTDGVQTLGKIPIDLKKMGVDFCSFSAHKVYSLKGTGLLYVKTGSPYQSLIVGGAQERSRRAGTENALSIACFGEALSLVGNIDEKFLKQEKLRNFMEEQITNKISDSFVLSINAKRLPNTSNIVFKDIDGESLLMNLDLKGFSVSTGAACSSGSSEPSPVLISMGLSRKQAQSSLRLSLGWQTTEKEINDFVAVLVQVVSRLRRLKEESRV